MTKTAHLNYVHNFRGIAIILIVVNHCLYWRPFEWTGHEDLFQFLLFISKGSSTYFVFIAGFLFQYLSHKYMVQKYLYSKLFNVVLPYLIISIPALYKAINEGIAFTDYPTWLQIVAYYVTGTHFLFFWFMPTIFLIYLLSPLLVKLDKNSYFYYSLPLLFVLSIFIQRDVQIGYHNPLQSLAHYLFFYVLGMAVSHYREALLPHMRKYWVFYTLAFGVSVYIDYGVYETLPGYFAYVSRYTLACLFVLFVLYRFDKQVGKTFHLFATMSFGIYFLHGYILSFLWRLGQKLHLVTPPIPVNLAYYLLLCALILLVTCLVLWIANKVLKSKSRMVVGY